MCLTPKHEDCITLHNNNDNCNNSNNNNNNNNKIHVAAMADMFHVPVFCLTIRLSNGSCRKVGGAGGVNMQINDVALSPDVHSVEAHSLVIFQSSGASNGVTVSPLHSSQLQPIGGCGVCRERFQCQLQRQQHHAIDRHHPAAGVLQ